MKDVEKASEEHIEVYNDTTTDNGLDGSTKVMGTVKLTEDSIIYIPTPTADPRGTSSLLCGSCANTDQRNRSHEHANLAKDSCSYSHLYMYVKRLAVPYLQDLD